MNYKRSKYFIVSSKRKIKYLLITKSSQITVVFFHGFMSDMVGAKPMAVQKLCRKIKLNFLKFEYSGHGKSKGQFTEGNISKWTNEAKRLIKLKAKNKNLIFIGSSMGSWIALNIAKNFKSQLKAFIGIASAPEFTEKLMWKKFPKKIKKILNEKKIVEIKNDYGSTYPITKNLIDNGRKNKIFSKLKLNLPSVLFHGTNDKSVPLIFSSKTLKLFRSLNKKIIKIKNGDHSLSRKSDIKKILKELTRLVNEI